MTNEAFIEKNKQADVHKLALSKAPDGIDLHYCLQQIAGLQTAQRKLPAWANRNGIVFPPKISMEQCSSEQAAHYKQQLVERLLPEGRHNMVDLTGGFGIDFSFLSPLFLKADYVERNEELCQIARHNFPLLGLKSAEVHNTSCEDFLDEMGKYSLIYIDPSRRDAAGRKLVALSDCSPDIEQLQEKLLFHAPVVVVKLSPMLDIKDTMLRLSSICEIHVVSVDGECKEILLVLCREKSEGVQYFCVNLAAKPQTFSTKSRETILSIAPALSVGHYLYEPNASILKAGIQDALCQSYDIQKLHPFSHLFISSHFSEDFPGRVFLIEDFCGFSKKDLKRLLTGIDQCNLTIRNFPSTVAELRKRLKLREGGNLYLFATTLGDGSHALLRCRQP